MNRMKKFLSLALALVLVLSMMPMPASAAGTDSTVYFRPNGNWLKDGAWFGLYYFNSSSNGWSNLSGPDANGYYTGTVPAGYTDLIFTRMNASASGLDWGNVWNQTGDQTLSTSNVYFTMPEGSWDSGSWTAVPKAISFTVAGEAGLCGTAWAPAATANDMTLSGGVWTKTYSQVPAGTYQFKVAMNHSWDGAWPSSNYSLTLTQTADVRITFNFATKTVTAVAVIPVTDVALDKTAVALYKDQTVTLTATVTPDNATDKDVTWTSSDTSVATVSGGVVTAVGGGTATITATAGGKSAACTVTVTEITSPVTLDVADGPITITASGFTQGYGTSEIPYTGSYIINGSTTDANFINISGLGKDADVTLNNVEINSNGRPPLMSSVPVHATGTLTLINGGSLATSGNLTITGDADITLRSGSPAISGGTISITCNSLTLESTNSVGISAGSVTVNAAEDISVTAAGGPGITCSATLNAGGDIVVESKTSNAVTANLTATAGGALTLKANSSAPVINGNAELSAGGDMSITNPGGMAVGGKLTVTDAASVTITGKHSGSPVLAAGADITSGGDVTITGAFCADSSNPNGYRIDAGGDISITGESSFALYSGSEVVLEAGGDITVTGKAGYAIVAKDTLALKAGGDVTVTGGTNFAISFTEDSSISAGGSVSLSGENSPTVYADNASKLDITAAGDITITNGSQMAVTAKAAVTMTSGGDINLTANVSAPTVNVHKAALKLDAAGDIRVENTSGKGFALDVGNAVLSAENITLSAPATTYSFVTIVDSAGYGFTDTLTTTMGGTTVKVTLVGDGLTLTGKNVPAEGKGFEGVLTADEGCALPTSITVTVGGTALTSGYTYDAASGKLTIDAASITGDVVIHATIPVTAVTLDKTAAVVLTGDELTLTATVTPANANNKTVTWSSDNTAVATVENGVVTTKAAGTATITATAGGLSATCKVTVQEPVASVTIDGVTTKYGNLQNALNAVKNCTAADNAVVKLLSNVTIQNTLSVSGGVFTLDLDTYTVSNSSSNALMITGGTVEIIGTTGKLSGTMGLSVLNKNANATISGGTVECATGTSSAVMNMGHLTVTGGTITGGQRGISSSNGSLSISGGAINGTKMGLYLSNTQVNITGGTITSDGTTIVHSDSQYSSGKISISGGTFSGGEKEFTDRCYGSIGRLPVLTGGTFSDGLVTGGTSAAFPVNDLLAEGYAFWQDGMMLTVADDATSIQGKVEVKPICYHEQGSYTAANNSVHWDCDDCEYRATLTLNPPENLVYDGTEKSVTVVVTNNLVNTQSWPEVIYEGDRVNVGTFTAKVTVAEGVEAKLDVTITPVVLTVTGAAVADKTYDGKTDASVTSINVSGINGNDDVIVKGTGVFSDAKVGSDKTVTITYTLTGAAAGNYVLAETTGTATASITKVADSSSPTTGDESNVLLWTVVMLLSMTAMVVVSKKRLFVK